MTTTGQMLVLIERANGRTETVPRKAVRYVDVPESEVPDDVRFDVPQHNQGQIVEVAYASARRGRDEACYGDYWRRRTDQSIAPGRPGRVTYARLTVVPLWGFEVRTHDGWSASAAGQQDASNCFASREEAEARVPALAAALGADIADVRVAEVR